MCAKNLTERCLYELLKDRIECFPPALVWGAQHSFKIYHFRDTTGIYFLF